jgi:hypothetical protein
LQEPDAMSGTSILLLASGLSTGLGIGFALWGWRAGRPGVAYLGAGMVLQGLAALAFYAVWSRSSSSY